jgi:phosphoribosylamine--glycine ligase
VFHAGTVERDGQIVTQGGRVLCVTALGNSVQEAQTQAYQHLQQIHWNGVYYRTDIGYRAIARESTTQ